MYRIARPLLFRLDAERAHALALTVLGAAARRRLLRGALARGLQVRDPRLATEAFGLRFPNPLGVAAGLDKDATALPAWSALGFGHVELGSVTARPQPGNPRPRMHRLVTDRAIVNRVGFPSEGAEAVAARLAAWRRRGAWPPVPVGVNLGKSRDAPLAQAAEDYALSVSSLAEYADYLVVNVSSPNTPGLRELQDEDRLRTVLARVIGAAGPVPVLVKLAPDLADRALASCARLAEETGAAGVVVVNTTLSRAGLRVDPGRPGGLSGRPLAARARSALRAVRAATALDVVSVGGIDSAAEAIRRLEAGADLLQLYTGLVYEGPDLVRRVLTGLVDEMERRGLSDPRGFREGAPRTAEDATGADGVSPAPPGSAPSNASR